MNKKLLVTGLVALSLGASLAFAAENPQPQQPAGHMMNWEQMKEYHQQMVEEAVKDGRMTAEQAKVMDEHMNTMGNMRQHMGGGMMNGMMGRMAGNGSAGGGTGCPGFQSQPGGSPK